MLHTRGIRSINILCEQNSKIQKFSASQQMINLIVTVI